MATPLQLLDWDFGRGIRTFIKRDDLLPMAGGGNKVRKIKPEIEYARQYGADSLVTVGGIQSNHCRVTAIAAAENSLRCNLILHGQHEPRWEANLSIMRLTGAKITYADSPDISKAVIRTELDLLSQGYKPHIIPGGGHSVRSSLAFVNAISELSFMPDFIVLASGTGATQAGIIAGCQHLGWSTKVLGISIARSTKQGFTSIEKIYDGVCAELGMQPERERIIFLDNWVGPGYGLASPDVYLIIKSIAEKTGVILDPTYTGKAFHGLSELASTSQISQRASVVFWHTGGLLNLLSDSTLCKANDS